MNKAVTVRTVADALQDAARWRADAESRHKSELVEVEQRLRELRHSLEQLRQQLDSLEQFREGLHGRPDVLAREEVGRVHEGLFAALEEQRAALEERSAELITAEASRAEMLESVLAQSDLASKLEEYRQFKIAVEPSLAQMPMSYRSVVLGHHEGVAAVLRARVAELMGDPVHARGGQLELEVVYAVDAPEGNPELLVVVTPVAAAAYEGWVDRPEDLQTRLAARVVQAIYQACHEAGLSGVQVMSGGHRGLLALEADIAGAPADIGTQLGAQLHGVFRAALELVAAKVGITARAVHADHILPPEDESDAE